MQEDVADCISINPSVCNGKPVLKGTRIPLTVILDQLASVSSLDEILRKYPELTMDQIHAVMRYCRATIEHTEGELIPA